MAPTAQPALDLLVLILVTSLSVIGILVFLAMLYRPRRGTMPHCPRCDYNLTGLTSERCPECGTTITPANLVYGEKVRQLWLKLAALAVVVGLLIPAVRWAWSHDWYRLKPTSWVLSDLESSDARLKSRALTELDRRFRAGSLSKSQENRLINICLKEQTAANPSIPMVNYLWVPLGGRLSPSQQATFFEQIVQLQMTVRPRVIAGGTLPAELRCKTWGPTLPQFWFRLKDDATPARLDGKAAKQWQGSGGSLGTAGCGGGSSSNSSIPLTAWEGSTAPGQHRLSLTVQVELWDNALGLQQNAPLLHRGELLVESDFEVLATEPADYIKLIDDPPQRAALQDAIRLENVRSSTFMDGQTQLGLRSRNVPINVAFELLARAAGREQHIGTMHMARGKPSAWVVSFQLSPPDSRFDLILRTSKQVAMETVDLFEIWRGELVYPDLRVEKTGPLQSQPATGWIELSPTTTEHEPVPIR
jgi:hypothetical protein